MNESVQNIPAAPEKTKGARVKKIRLAVIALAVLAMSVVSFLLPLRPQKSDIESRTLAAFPEFSLQALFSGDYFEGIAAWYADTVPFRDTLTGAASTLRHLIGAGGALSGFNEGVRGDEIPDLPTGPLPPETAAPSTESTTEAPAESTTEAPTEPPTEPPTQAPTEPATEGAAPIPQKLSNILIYGNAGYEYYNFNQSASEKYVQALNYAAAQFAGKARVYAMIVPTSMGILLPESVQQQVSVSDQKRAIDYMEALMDPSITRVSIYDTLKAHMNDYIYFRTDHHWTGLGAYYAYQKFCEAKGVRAVAKEECVYRAFDNFLGSFYADSGSSPALGATPDVVETFMPPVNADMKFVDASGTHRTGSVIYNAESNAPRNKYGAYIWGDNQFSVIENYDMAEGESCLFIKESFGNALAPLLTYNYKYVYILDYRYDYTTARKVVEEYGVTDIFFCNNISMTRAASQVELLQKSLG